MKFRLATGTVVAVLLDKIFGAEVYKQIQISANAPQHSSAEITPLIKVAVLFNFYRVIVNVISGEIVI